MGDSNSSNIGWLIRNLGFGAISIWEIEVLDIYERTNRPRGMREAFRCRYKYRKHVWSIHIDIDSLEKNILRNTGKVYEVGMSEIAINRLELQNKAINAYEKATKEVENHLFGIKLSIESREKEIEALKKELDIYDSRRTILQYFQSKNITYKP